MAPIATYVFFDLETTGLPSLEANKTRITEFSMMALKRRHIVRSASGQLPRVIHKLTMCFNPDRQISEKAAEVSGFSNTLLEHEVTFNEEVFNLINTFIGLQEKPVCLIAHNGHSFDLPILKNHFEKLNVSLPDDIMCADSIYCFYDLLNAPQPANVRAESDEDLMGAPRPIAEVLRRRYYDGTPFPQVSYRLTDVYQRVLGRPGQGAHSAEGDCIMIAEITVAIANEFIDWVDRNYCRFSEVMSMPI